MVKFTIDTPQVFEAKYLKCELGVRYWEDATVNGEEDEDGTRIPFRKSPSSNTWEIVIDLDEGVIVDWPKGVTADVHYKVCDEGAYVLKDADGKTIIAADGYVPDMLAPCGKGYGDYVIMKIDENGKIDGFEADLFYFNRRR